MSLSSALAASPVPAALRRLFLDRAAEFWLGRLAPAHSLIERRARVALVLAETRDVKTFVLEPSRWPGHVAGQYVPVTVEIDGRRHTRCYSITTRTTPAGAPRIAIAVARVPGGKVSNFLHDHVHAGAIVTLGDPAGDFVLPDPTPPQIALIAGGSGVTPILALARELRHRNSALDLAIVHAARDDAAAAFATELAALADAPGARLVAHRGPLTVDALRAAIPDLARRAIYTCGPAGMMDVVSEAAAGAPVLRERFVATAPRAAAGPQPKARVYLTQARRTVALDGDGTLLEQLERAGERPAHGCRMGICNTCACTARGATRDLATGAASGEPDRTIHLCTSVAAGDDLELSL